MSGVDLGGGVSHPSDDAIKMITPKTIMKVEFTFHCYLLPGVYFLNAGVVGSVDGQESYLHRCIDAAMFRVQAERDLLATTIIDFQIQAKTIESPHLIEI